ncbi:MAG: hypothetical protein R6X32_09260 [Chloroflexota bacterium]
MGRRRQRPAETAAALSRLSVASLLLLGLVLGLAGSLYYAWVVDPIIFVNASPSRLTPIEQEEYIIMVSQSYASDGNWPLAQQRLDALDDPDLPQTMGQLLDRFVREGRPPALLRDVAQVAQQLGSSSRAVALFAPTPLPGSLPTATPTPPLVPVVPTMTATAVALATDTPTPTATFSAVPTPLPSPTTRPNYRLLTQQRVCEAEPVFRIEVLTWDAFLEPEPGVEVVVRWQGGEDRFYTGFKPDQGADYGDFTMEPEISYSVQLAAGSPEITGLRIEPCDSGLPGGWQLTFQNLLINPTPTPANGN